MTTAILDMPTKLKPRKDSTPVGRIVPGRVVLDRIVLTGFMGSGKTTAGTLLAERLGWRFLDLDHEIERRQALAGHSARTVPEIFAQLGEPHFRRIETATLVYLLGRRNVVIALGGGAPEELANRLLLEQTPHTAVVYLSAPFEILVARCNEQASIPGTTVRPVLADLTTAEQRFHLRRTHYERIAAHTVDTTRLTLEQTADQTLNLLQEAR